jgi:hypothetical protein
VKRQGWLIWVLVLLLLPTAAQAQSKAAWTIIYYSAADNDLEQFMIGDLMEMNIIGSTEDVNIVFQMDRAEGYDEVNGTWTDTRRFLVTQATDVLSSGDFAITRDGLINFLSELDPEEFGLTPADMEAELDNVRGASQAEIEDLAHSIFSAPPGGGAAPIGVQVEAVENKGEIASSDPDALVDFATWAIAQYPADKYMLILSNHGGGWTGVAFDESEGNDALTMREVDTALSEIIASTDIGKFEIIGFDACLMAQLEIFQMLAPYANFAIASEEVIPGAGWEYVTPLAALTQNPAMTAPEFGKLVIDGYMEYYTTVMEGYTAFDLHVYDLSQVDAVMASLENFAQAVQANPADNLLPIGRARDNAQTFSADDPEAAAFFSSVDLMDFMRVLQNGTEDANLKSAAQAVIDASEAMVLYGRASDGLPGSTGIAIYFPANLGDYDIATQKSPYLDQNPGMAGWQNFLNTFYGIAIETLPAGDLTLTITDVEPRDFGASIWDPPVILFNTTGTGVVDMQFYASLDLGDGLSVIVDASQIAFYVVDEEGNELESYPDGETTGNQFQWNVETPIMSDAAGNSQLVALIAGSGNDTTSTISGVYHFANGKQQEAYLVVDEDEQKVVQVFGVEAGPLGQAVGEIKPQRGETFEPYYLVLDAEGKINYEPSETKLAFSDEPFTYKFVPALDGNYKLAIWIEDMAGNVAFDSTTFAVDSAELDANWRGFKDIDMGINFVYPWGWFTPDVLLNEDGSYTMSMLSDDVETEITVDTYDAESYDASRDALLQLAADFAESIGATSNPPETGSIEFNDVSYDAGVLQYTYKMEDGTERAGYVLVVEVPDNGYGYMIVLDGRLENATRDQEVFDYIINSVFFFPPYDYGD